MGSGFSKGNSCFIQTDKQVYHDGDYVQGIVCLNLTTAVEISNIEAQLLAYEKTHWTTTSSSTNNNQTTSHTNHHGGTFAFLDVTSPLTGGNRSFQPGQYQWQVVFALPPGVPSTYRVGSGSEGARVTYELKVTFHRPGMLKSAIRQTAVLRVHQRIAMPPDSSVVQSGEKALKTCCCFGAGFLSAQARLDRGVCQPGQTVEVLLSVDNRSKNAVKGIEVCVKRKTLMGEHPKQGDRWRGQHKSLDQTFSKAQHPGLQPFTALQGSMARRMHLQLPPDLQPTLNGVLIQSHYTARVKIKMGMGTSGLEIKVPLTVVAPQQPAPPPEAEPFYTTPPAFWAPSEVQGPVALDVPSAPPPPAELLKPDAPFWARSLSNKRLDSGPPPAV